jgi:hypothetical protein
MSIKSKRGRREEKRRKTRFIILKSLFFFLLYHNYSFASAVPRRIGELKVSAPITFLNHSKGRRDEEDIIKGSVIGGVRS